MTRQAALFADRVDAGRRLGQRLHQMDLSDPVLLGLPRGGVVVAAHVAAELDVAVDVLVARKIGHPRQPEYGLGAIAEGGDAFYDLDALRHSGLAEKDLEGVVAAERIELARRVHAYRGGRALAEVSGSTVVLVDDGVATGATARAALRALRAGQPARLLLAVPLAAEASLQDLAAEADELVVLETPTPFGAVGRWYRSFDQVPDEEVIALLATPPGPRSR